MKRISPHNFMIGEMYGVYETCTHNLNLYKRFNVIRPSIKLGSVGVNASIYWRDTRAIDNEHDDHVLWFSADALTPSDEIFLDGLITFNLL